MYRPIKVGHVSAVVRSDQCHVLKEGLWFTLRCHDIAKSFPLHVYYITLQTKKFYKTQQLKHLRLFVQAINLLGWVNRPLSITYDVWGEYEAMVVSEQSGKPRRGQNLRKWYTCCFTSVQLV